MEELIMKTHMKVITELNVTFEMYISVRYAKFTILFENYPSFLIYNAYSKFKVRILLSVDKSGVSLP